MDILLPAAFFLSILVYVGFLLRIILRNAAWAKRVVSDLESGRYAELRGTDAIARDEWPEDGTIPRLVFRYSPRLSSNVFSEVGFVAAGRLFLLTTGEMRNPDVVRTFSQDEGARFVRKTSMRYFPYLQEIESGGIIRCASANDCEEIVAALTAEGMMLPPPPRA